MKILSALFLIVTFACNSKNVYREVARTEKIDPDIILFNIANSNRAEIAALLLDIDKCSPLMVGVDITFPKHKEFLEDSILADALEKTNNDILAYRFNSAGKEVRSIDEFRKFASDEGYVNLDRREEVASHFIPVRNVDGNLHESFALKIIKRWKPELKYNLPAGKSIPILFLRSQQQYYYFIRKDLLDENVCELLKGKIVLVGFLGPGDEDKHYTPIGGDDKDQEGKPDTYGLVIQANAIRTILQHMEKD